MINDLKSKIPVLAKKQQVEEIEDENTHESSDQTQVDASAGDKTSSTNIEELNSLNDGTEEELENEQGSQSLVQKLKGILNKNKDGDQKKPNKSKAIILAAILILAILFLFEDESNQQGGNEAGVTDSQKAMEEKIAKRKKERDALKKKENQSSESKTETAATETKPDTESTDKTAETSPDVSSSTTESADKTAEPAPDSAASTTESTENNENSLDSTASAESESAKKEGPVENTTVSEIDTTENSSTENTDNSETVESKTSEDSEKKIDESPIAESTGADTIDETPKEENGDLTDKILEDLEKKVKSETPKEQKKEYVSPPDFEFLGRGLVYNCTGKHWACIDGPSFKLCEDNYSSVQYLKKPIECYPSNVYETQKGCESMQNRMVSSGTKTKFCNGN